MWRLYTLSYIAILILSCNYEVVIQRKYYDVQNKDTLNNTVLIAVTNEDFLQFGSSIAFLDTKGDTIIPFGKYAYLGTDTLRYFANVIEFQNATYGDWIAINRDEKILYEVINYDNGPDYFSDGLVRVKRNNKMGFANDKGKVLIPCIYDYAWPFENGVSKVSFNAKILEEKGIDHYRIVSEEWFLIDKTNTEITER